MTTLQDLKTKYQAELAQAQAQAEVSQKAIETQRQLKLTELKSRIIAYLAQQEGVDEAELVQGELDATWDADEDTKVYRVVFALALPEHQPVSMTFYEDSKNEVRINNKFWHVSGTKKDGFETLGEALTIAARVYRQNQEYTAREEAEAAAWRAEQQARQEWRQAQDEQLLEALSTDPLALALVQLFVKMREADND